MNDKPMRAPADGDHCSVIDGTHKGKERIVADLHLSKTGHLTVTVIQRNGERFKTLAKNLRLSADNA